MLIVKTVIFLNMEYVGLIDMDLVFIIIGRILFIR